jgi:hypothetical protein
MDMHFYILAEILLSPMSLKYESDVIMVQGCKSEEKRKVLLARFSYSKANDIKALLEIYGRTNLNFF